MAIFSRNKETFTNILRKYFIFKNETRSLDPLHEVFQSVKTEDFDIVLGFFKDQRDIAENFGYYLRNIFRGKPFNLSLTEANILSENAFAPELKKRLLNTVLPPVENENTVWHLVDYVSVRTAKDYEYFKNIPKEELDELFELLGVADFITTKEVKQELLFSMNILAWRVIGNAMDVEVINMAPSYRNYDNPFLALQNELESITNLFNENPDFQLTSKEVNYKQVKIYITQCLAFVDQAFKNSSKYGISGKINQSLLKIRQQTQRISEILSLLVIDEEKDKVMNSKQLVFNILNYKSHKNNISELVADSTTLMSHLITNHTAETGTHYISSTSREYREMFWKASGGGIIVGFLCVLKMLYSYTTGSEFSHAFLYAFNYAMGFIMIYLMNYTLATKQPAMTAATMAKVLSAEENTKKNYRDFAHLVSKLFRTQFIAFVGNVLWAFPVALCIIYGLDVLFNQNLAVEKSSKLLHDLDIFDSKAIFHACIAGFFLFISGIIAGNVGNNSVFYQIPKRIAKNPAINLFLGKKVAQSVSVFYAKNWSGIVSNFWFGVFLGVTAPLGHFFGLDLDIRHITFAAGNFALGLYGKEFSVDGYTFWMSFSTVFLIGFFNFIVSFGLSMLLAFRSRKVNFGEVAEIYKEIFRYFISNPLKFFLPLKSHLDSTAKEMVKKVTTKSEDH